MKNAHHKSSKKNNKNTVMDSATNTDQNSSQKPSPNFLQKIEIYAIFLFNKFISFFNKGNPFNEAGIGLVIVLILIGILVVILVNPAGFKSLTDKFAIKPVSPTATPTPTPTPIPLPKGPREFGVSSSANPQISDLKFSEYDPVIGQQQTITLSVLDKQGNVTSVEVALKTDHKTKTYPLTLSSGTPKKGDWSVNISTDDTHDYKYSLILTVKDDKGQSAIVNPIFK